MKKLICLVAIFATASACTSVSTTKVGDKDIVHVSQIGIQLFNSGGAPVSECVNTLGKEGATRVITAVGQPATGLFGLTRSIQTIGLDQCIAAGEK